MTFNFDATDPGDTSIASQFPNNERQFRAMLLSYLSVEHDASASFGAAGYHSFQLLSTTAKSSIINPPPGMLLWDTTQGQLNMNTGSATTPIWTSIGPVPTGTVLWLASGSAPPGYLPCDGASYQTSVYPALEAVIGATYGGGVGTFNVPDLRGRVAIGFDSGNATGRIGVSGGPSAGTLGNTGGEQAHILAVSEMPSHGHTATVNDPGHTHNINLNTSIGLGGGGQTTYDGNTGGPQNVIQWAQTGISVTIGNQGGGATHNNVQPCIVLYPVIKF